MMTHQEIMGKLKESFPNVWVDDSEFFAKNGVKAFRCTENSEAPYGKVVTLVIVDDAQIHKRWFDANLSHGLEAYETGTSGDCVGYGWCAGYGKIGRPLQA